MSQNVLSGLVGWCTVEPRAAQPIRKCHESHVLGIGTIVILNDPAPSLNEVSIAKNRLVCGKLMARQILTRFDPDKKSAVL